METFGKLSKSLPSMLEWVLALLLEPTAQDSMSILKKNGEDSITWRLSTQENVP